MFLGKLDNYMQKSETRSPTYTMYKNKLEIDWYLNVGPKKTHESPRRKPGYYALWLALHN